MLSARLPSPLLLKQATKQRRKRLLVAWASARVTALSLLELRQFCSRSVFQGHKKAPHPEVGAGLAEQVGGSAAIEFSATHEDWVDVAQRMIRSWG